MFKYSQNRKEIQSTKRMNEVAASLRKNQTPAEQHLWKYLRKNRLGGYKFRRQHAIGKYIVDFLCNERKLIIEVDGEVHAEHQEHDAARDHHLQLCGYTTLRFSNEEVLNQTLNVLNRIRQFLKPSPVL